MVPESVCVHVCICVHVCVSAYNLQLNSVHVNKRKKEVFPLMGSPPVWKQVILLLTYPQEVTSSLKLRHNAYVTHPTSSQDVGTLSSHIIT